MFCISFPVYLSFNSWEINGLCIKPPKICNNLNIDSVTKQSSNDRPKTAPNFRSNSKVFVLNFS